MCLLMRLDAISQHTRCMKGIVEVAEKEFSQLFACLHAKEQCRRLKDGHVAPYFYSEEARVVRRMWVKWIVGIGCDRWFDHGGWRRAESK